jgi:hypothetical protein
VTDAVTVYRWKYWDAASESYKTSSWYATDELIRKGLGAAVPHTAVDVPLSELRSGGIYVPPERGDQREVETK